MKSSYLLSLVTGLLFSVLSFGQKTDRIKTDPKPTITKGYYSIGTNSQKLHVYPWPSPDTAVIPIVNKGYYSIGSNNKTLKKKSGWFRNEVRGPVASKGYYSIGNNAQKPDSSK